MQFFILLLFLSTILELKAVPTPTQDFDYDKAEELERPSIPSEFDLLSQGEEKEKHVSWSPRVRKKGEPPSPPPTQKTPQKKKSFPKSIFQIGGNYTYAHISPTKYPSFHGHLGGFQTSFEYKPPNRVYSAAFFSWNQGNTDSSKGNRFFFKIDLQERLGYSWYMKRKGRFFTLFSGLGYRHTGHRLKSLGSKIHFDYNQIYFPVGFLFLGMVNEITHLGLNFQWMPQVYPTLKISPLKGARWILEKRYTNFKAELPIKVTLWKKHHLAVTFNPTFEYFRDGHTDAKTQQGEQLKLPGNTYLFAGIDINLGCAF